MEYEGQSGARYGFKIMEVSPVFIMLANMCFVPSVSRIQNELVLNNFVLYYIYLKRSMIQLKIMTVPF